MGKQVKNLFFLLILIAVWAISLSGQDRLRCRQISLEDGLSQTSIFAIAQDKLGFIWVGTESGLNRYDGYKFRVYTEDRINPNSICNSCVWSMHIDSAGDLWLGTDGGLSQYIPATDSFISYLADPQKNDALSNERVMAIYEDRARQLWVGTDGGLNRLDRRSGKFTRFLSDPRDNTTLSNNLVRAITQDHDGFLWVGTDGGGLNRMNLQTGRFDHFGHDARVRNTISDNSVGALFEDHAGRLWIGTHRGLDCWDAARTQVRHYTVNAQDPLALSNDWINCIFADRSGRLWFGTNEGGVCRYAPEKNGFINFRHDPDDATSVGQDRVLSIIEDNSENLWFGTYAAGLSKYNKNIAKFKLYRPERNNPNSLSHSNVRKIVQESPAVFWICTDGGGLNRFERTSGKFSVFKKDAANPNSISSNRPFNIFRDHEGIYWVATADGGLNKFESRVGKFTAYRNDPANPASVGGDFVRAIAEDRAGNLWLGLDGAGLNRFDKRSGRCKRYMPDPGNPNSLSHYRVFCLHFDQAGILWIGTYGGGLNRFDPVTERFASYHYIPQMATPENTLDINVLCLIEDRHGLLWLGTSQGLTRFNRDTGAIRTFTVAQGLPDGVIYAIVEDHDGNLWLTTNRGLSRFNPTSEKFKNFTVDDGLQSNEFSTYSDCIGADGELFFGGINGFNAFYPDQITDNTHIPAIVLTRFQLFNRDVPIAKPIDGRVVLERAIGVTDSITLAHTQNALAFEFAALDCRAPEKNQYAYMMDGLDTSWNYVGNRRLVSYASIPPGEYTFRVKGSNNDGLWNERGVALRITIVPPFWRTRWFTLLCLALALAASFAAYRQRIRSLTKRQAELENLVMLRTQELKDISLKDPLTGLRNRRYIKEVLLSDVAAFLKKKAYLMRESSHRRRNEANFFYGILMVDIDYFKTINDVYGHDMGDKWLVQFAHIMRQHLRADDEVIRYGGEEFMVILKNIDMRNFSALVLKLKEKLDQVDRELNNTDLMRTCSIGYTQFPFYEAQQALLSFDDTLLLADLALYHAKKNGRNMAVQVLPGELQPDQEQVSHMLLALDYGAAHGFYRIEPSR